METYEEHMNNVATDILTCPECMDEEVETMAHQYDKETEVLTTDFKCLCCDHVFSESN